MTKFAFFSVFVLIGCGSADVEPMGVGSDFRPEADGGTEPADAARADSAAADAGAGGASGSGGAPATGGVPAAGGAVSAGGKATGGDPPNTGGTGGVASTGGAPNTGGAMITGGAPSTTGGAPSAGGASSECVEKETRCYDSRQQTCEAGEWGAPEVCPKCPGAWISCCYKGACNCVSSYDLCGP